MSTLNKFKESRLQSLSFDALALDGSNFLEWNNDAKTFSTTEELVNVLDAETATELSPICNWHAFFILRQHLDTSS